MWRLLVIIFSEDGESRSRVFDVLGVPDCKPLKTSSPKHELVRLCEIAISRAVLITSSQSCANAAVVDPSDDADFGSSKS